MKDQKIFLNNLEKTYNQIKKEINKNIEIENNKKLINYKTYYRILKKNYKILDKKLKENKNKYYENYNLIFHNQKRLYYEIDYYFYSYIINNKINLYKIKDNEKTLNLYL